MKRFLCGFCSWLLSLPAVIFLTALLLCWPLSRLLTPGLYLGIVDTPAVLNELQAKVGAQVDEAAAEYSFTPATVAPMLSRDALQAYAHRSVEWFAAFLHGSDEHAPAFDTAAIEEAIRGDELFVASHAPSQLRSVSRDQAGWKIQRIVERTVFPLRTEILRYAQKLVLSTDRLKPVWPLLPFLPLILLGAAALFLLPAGLIQRRYRDAWRWIGACLIAAALLACVALLWAAVKDLPLRMSGTNQLFLTELRILERKLTIHTLIPAGIALIAGVCLMARRSPEGRS